MEALEAALGPELVASLSDPEVQEILCRSDGSVWLDRESRGLVRGSLSLEPETAEALLTFVSGLAGQELTAERPYLECELPFDGSRLSALVPPITPAPCFAIRKRAERVYRIGDYAAAGILGAHAADVLTSAVTPTSTDEEGANLVIAGGPGSGKTTLANALLAEMAESEGKVRHVVLIEDTWELQSHAPCKESMQTTDGLDLRFLVKRAMRQRPDRLIIGEVRGGEALDMLKAWNTGTGPSLTTVHANGAVDALYRLDHLAQEGGVPSAQRLVAEAVGLVVFIARTARGRKVTELVRVHGLTADGEYDVEPLL